MAETAEQWVRFGKKFRWCLMESWPKYAPANLIPKKDFQSRDGVNAIVRIYQTMKIYSTYQMRIRRLFNV